MKKTNNFYLDSIRGRASAEAVHGTFCVYSLLERVIADYLRAYEFTPMKFNALMLIKHIGKKKGLTQNEISQHMIVHPSSITRLLDRMNKEGLITREASKEDRRANYVKITSKGSETLDKVFHGYGETVQQSAYLLERSEVEQLGQLLIKWFSKLDESYKESGGGGHESK